LSAGQARILAEAGLAGLTRTAHAIVAARPLATAIGAAAVRAAFVVESTQGRGRDSTAPRIAVDIGGRVDEQSRV
jgi:hypothetical protein